MSRYKSGENNPSYSHGMYGTRFYRIWGSMKTRCYDENTSYYKNYGGRGIMVCEDWLDFKNFMRDMYDSYLEHVEEFGEKHTSIDRIENDGNYHKENCKWSTCKEQGRNRRSNRYVIIDGKTKTLREWSEYFNISIQLMSYRLAHGRYTN